MDGDARVGEAEVLAAARLVVDALEKLRWPVSYPPEARDLIEAHVAGILRGHGALDVSFPAMLADGSFGIIGVRLEPGRVEVEGCGFGSAWQAPRGPEPPRAETWRDRPPFL